MTAVSDHQTVPPVVQAAGFFVDSKRQDRPRIESLSHEEMTVPRKHTEPEYIRLRDVPPIIAEMTGDPEPATSTVHRWRKYGHRGKKLKCKHISGAYRTTRRWLDDFFTVDDCETIPSTNAEYVANCEKLRAMGVRV